MFSFRVWDIARHTYWYDVGLFLKGFTLDQILSNENFILEQESPHHDRDGEPVYDGDILEFSDGGVAVCQFDGSSFSPLHQMDSTSNMRVIGSLNKDPELLLEKLKWRG